MKKYVVALGTFGVAVSPIITVVSCNKTPTKNNINTTSNNGLEKKVNKIIGDYFTSKKNEVKEIINMARVDSNTQEELRESIVKELSSKIYAFWVLEPEKTNEEKTPDEEQTIKKTIELVLRQKLKISADTPAKRFHNKNSYKLLFNNKKVFNEELKKLDANLDFYKNINSMLPLAIESIESMDGDKTLKEFFAKNSSLIGILKEKLTSSGLLGGEVDKFLGNIYSLDFKISDIKKIHLSLNKIIHNVDFNLSKLKNSENVLEQVIALTKDKDIILDSNELNQGMQGLISAMADLALRNKENIPAIISIINMFKPGTISEKFASVILSVSKTNIFNEFFNALKNITIEQVQVLEDNILNIAKSTDWINFDIFKFITNEKNQERINNILKTLSLGQKTDEIKNVQEIALTLEKIAKKLKLDLSDLIKNKGEGIFNKLISLISSDEFKKLDKQKLSKDVSHLIKNLISLISSESDNIDNIIELINSLKPNLISSNMKKIITIIVKSDVMKDLAQVKEETLNKILHLDFSVDDILGLLKKWLKLPKDASFIDVFKGLSETLKQIGVLSDKQIETMNKLMGSDFVTKALSKPGVIKKLKEIFEYNFKKINLNFLVKIIKDFKETKDFKATLTSVLKDLVKDESNWKSIKLIATESINYLLAIDNEEFTNINDLLKLVKEMGLISADMVKKIEATLNYASFKEFVINNPDLIKSVKAILLNPLNSPRAKALVQKIVEDLINKDREELIKDAKQYFVYGKGLDKNMQAIFKSFVTKVLVLDNGELTNVNLLLKTYIKVKPNSELAKKLGIILNSKFVKDILNQPKVIAKVKEMILQNADKLTLASIKKIIDLMKNGKSNEVTQFIIKTILDDEKNIASLKLIIKESVNYLLIIDNAEFANINNLLELAKKMELVSDEQLTKIIEATKSPIFKLFITNNEELVKVFKDLLSNPLKSSEINALLKKMIQDLIKQDRKALIDDAIKYFVDANAKDGLLDSDLQKVFKSFVTKVLITDGQGNLTNVKLLLNTLEKMSPTSEVLKKLQVILNSKFAKDIFSQPKVIAKIQEILNYNIEKLNLEGVKKILELVKGKKYDQITEIIFKVALGDETNFANIKLIFKESINYLFTLDSKGKYAHLNSLLNIAKELKLITPTMVPQIMDILNGKVFKAFVIDNPEIINVFKQLIFSPLDKPETKALIKKMIQDLIKQDRKALIDDAMQYFVSNPKLDANMQAVFTSFVTKALVLDNGKLTNVNLLLETYKKAKPNSELAKKLGIILGSKFVKDVINQPKVIAKVKEMILQNADKLNILNIQKIIDLMKNGKSNEVAQFIFKIILDDEKNIASLKLIVKESINYLLTIDNEEFANINNLLELAKKMGLVSDKQLAKITEATKSPIFKLFITSNKKLIKVFKDLLLNPLKSIEINALLKKMIQDLIKQDRKALIDDAIKYFVDANAKDGLLDSDLQKVFKSFVAKVLLTDGQGNLTNVKLLLNTLEKMSPTSEVLKKLQVILNSKFAKDIFSQPKVIAKIQEILNYNIEKLNLEGVKKILELVKGKKYDQITEIIFKAALEDETNFANIKLIFKESINYLFTLDSKGKYAHLNSLLNIAKELKLITPTMVPQIMDILNGKVFKTFVIDNPEIINVFKQLIFSPLDKPETKALIKKMIQDLIKQDRKALIDDAMQYFVSNPKLDANIQAVFTSFVTKVLVLDDGKLTNVNLLLETYKKAKPNSELAKKLGIILGSKFVKDVINQPKVIAKVKEMILQNADKLNILNIQKIIDLMKNGKSNEVAQFIFKIILDDEKNIASLKLIVKESINYLLTIDNEEFANINNLLELAKKMGLVSDKQLAKITEATKSPIFKLFITSNKKLIKVFKDLLLNPLKSIEINALLKKMIQDLIKQDRKALIDDAIKYFVDANAKDGLLDSDLQKVFKSFVAKVLLTDGQGNLTNVKLLLNTLEKMSPTSEVLKKLQVILNSKFAKDIFSQPKVIAKIQEILNYNIEKLNLEGVKKILELVKGKKYDQITEIIFKAALEDETNFANIKLIFKESINYLFTLDSKGKYAHLNSLLNIAKELKLITPTMVPQIMDILNGKVFKTFVIDNPEIINVFKQLIFSPLDKPETKALIKKMIQDLIKQDRKALIDDAMQYFVSNPKLDANIQAVFTSFVTKVLVLDDGKLTNVNLLLETYKKAKPNSELAKKLGIILGSKFVKDVINQPKVIAKVKEMILQNADKLNILNIQKIIDLMKNGKSNEVAQFIFKIILDDEKNIASLKLIVKESINYLLTIDNEEFANINNLLELAKKMGLVSDKQLAKITEATKSPIFKLFITSNKKLIKVFKDLLLNPLKSIEINALLKKMIQDLIKQDRKALIDDAIKYFVDANAKDGLLDSDLQKVFKSFVAKVLLTDGQGNLTNVKLLLNTLKKMNPTSETLKKLQVILNSKFAVDIFKQPKVIAKIKEILNYNIEKLNLEGVKKILELVKGKKYDQITEIIFKAALEDETNFANIKLIFKESINYLFTLDSKGKYAHLNSLLNIAKELKLITPTMVPQIMDILNGKVFKTFVIDNPEIINVFKQLIFSPLDKPETKALIKKMIQDLIKQDRKALIDDAIKYFVDANAKDGLLDSDLQKVFKSFVAKVLLTDGQGNLINVKLLLNTLEKMNPTSEVLKKLQVILNGKFAKDIFKQPKVIAKIKEILNYNIEKLNLEGVKKILELVKGKKYDQITEIIFKAALEDETNLANIQLIIKESINYLLTINKNKFTNINQLLKSLRESGFMSEQLVKKIIKVLDSPLIISLIKNEKPFVKAVINLINDNFANLSEEQILNVFKALKNKDYSLLTKNLLQGNIFSNEKSAKDLQLILEKITEFILAKNKDGKIGDHISLLLNEMKKYNLFSDKIDKIQKILNTDIMKGILSDNVINESIKKLININIKKLSPKKLKEIFEAFSQGKLKETLKQIITKDVLGDEDSIKELTVVFQGVLTFVLKHNDKLEFANLNKLLNTFKNMGMYTKQITVFQNIFKSEIFVELSKNEGFLTAITELIKFNITNINSETTKKILQLMMQKNYAGILNVLIESNLSNPKAAGHLKTIINTVIDYTLTLNKDGKLGNLSKILKLIGTNSRFGNLLTVVTDNLDKNKFFKEFLISKQEILNKLKVHLKKIANNLLDKDTFKKVMNILKSDNKISVKLKELWTSTKVFGKETKGFIVDVINRALTHISNILGHKNLSWNDIQDFINKIDAKDELKKEMIQLVSLFLSENTPSTSIQSIITKLKNIVSHINPDKLLLIFDVMGNSKLSMKGKALQILQIPGLISNENNAQEDLKALVKEMTINALTNMLNGGNLNNYKNALQLFGVKLSESKWTNISNLLKLCFENTQGVFNYTEVRALVAEIIDNTNLSIVNIQKIVSYFTSEKFNASLKGATGMKDKLKLFLSVIKKPEILAVMKDPAKFLKSINKFGYFIVKNILGNLSSDNSKNITKIANLFTELGIFSKPEIAKKVLVKIKPLLKDIYAKFASKEGTTIGGIVMLIGKHRKILVEALDYTLKPYTDKGEVHVTYTDFLKFIENGLINYNFTIPWWSFDGGNVKNTTSSQKNENTPKNIDDLIEKIVKIQVGRLFFINIYKSKNIINKAKSSKGKRTMFDKIVKMLNKIGDATTTALGGVPEKSVLGSNVLLDKLLTESGLLGGAFKDDYPELLKKLTDILTKIMPNLEEVMKTDKGSNERKQFAIDFQAKIRTLLKNVFNIRVGRNGELVNKSDLEKLNDSFLFGLLLQFMGIK